jgi:hypothetical protein
MRHFTDDQIMAEVKTAFLTEEPKPPTAPAAEGGIKID